MRTVIHSTRRVARSLAGGAALLVLTAAALLPDRERARAKDVLVPARGREIEGHLVRMDSERVHFQVETRDKFFDRAEVETVRSPLLLYPELAERLSNSRPGDVLTAVQAAEWCRDVGLEQEADFAWWRVLAYDWNNAEAHAALDSKESSYGWKVKLDRRYYLREKLYERVTDWDTAFELDLALFKVRSSARLEDTLDWTSALVQGYQLVYDLFGDLMDLPYPREVTTVHIHGDSKSYPKQNPRSAYYDPQENRIVADARLWDGALTVAHEVTHSALANAFLTVAEGSATPPPWVTEGMAEHVSAAIEARLEGVEDRFQSDRARRYVRLHASAEEPQELNRVLTGGDADFHDLEDSDIFYAQGFTLVWFLMEADRGRYRDGFAKYLRDTFEAKASPTHLRDALGMDLDDVEERWHEWVREVALR